MRTSMAKKALMMTVRTKKGMKPPVVPFLRGKPGIGKTDIFKQVADELGCTLIDVRLSQIDSVDLRGVPRGDDKEGITRWLPPEFLPFKDINKFKDASAKGIRYLLAFDEMNRARNDVQQAVFQLVRDRKCGEHELIDDVIIVAAGNLGAEDGCDVNEMDAALKNRFFFIDVEHNVEDWIDWARSAAIRPEIISFINAHPRFLWFEFDGQEKMAITPRTWENFSRIIDNNADVATIEDVVMMLGPVALDGASATFLEHVQSLKTISAKDVLERYEEVLPTLKEMPRDKIYQLREDFIETIKTLGDNRKPHNVDNFNRFVLELLSDEMMIATLAGMVKLKEESGGAVVRQFTAELWKRHPDTEKKVKRAIMSNFSTATKTEEANEK